jgi:hypothetical protein
MCRFRFAGFTPSAAVRPALTREPMTLVYPQYRDLDGQFGRYRLGEMPGGEMIRRTREDARAPVLGKSLGDYNAVLNAMRAVFADCGRVGAARPARPVHEHAGEAGDGGSCWTRRRWSRRIGLIGIWTRERATMRWRCSIWFRGGPSITSGLPWCRRQKAANRVAARS